MLRFAPPHSRAPSAGASTSTSAPRISGSAGEVDATALVRRVACGDPQALDAVYRSEGAAVYRYAFGLCGNPAWAADATQDAFVVLATQPQRFDARRGTLGAWLAGIARHALLAQWRQRAAESPWPGPDGDEADGPADAAGAAAPSPETLLVRAQSGAQVWAAVCRLPFAQREAVVLVDLQERSYEDAARIAGIETNTLRTRLHRGRARLAQWLAGDDR